MLIKKGAEAELLLESFYGKKVILKRRIRKRYRHHALDEEIRSYRTTHESLMMHRAKKCGVSTPIIYRVDTSEMTIVMEFVDGVRLRDVLDSLPTEERRRICLEVGRSVARMHKRDLIHGDLTTSNILMKDGKIIFIDFGLSEVSTELEKKGVDLHLMKSALQSSHFRHFKECFHWVLEGYGEGIGKETAEEVISKIGEIEKRGRYISER